MVEGQKTVSACVISVSFHGWTNVHVGEAERDGGRDSAANV